MKPDAPGGSARPRDSLDAAYFDGVFAGDPDPWSLGSSPYEAEKFDRTCAILADRRYGQALEIGCAHGVLTERLLTLCDRLTAVDISAEAISRARARLGERAGLDWRRMAFPGEAPAAGPYDLVVLSEVAYYWSDVDLDRAADRLRDSVAAAGRVILVHYTGETDYPQSGDAAVETLWRHLAATFAVVHAERRPGYRLDLWARA